MGIKFYKDPEKWPQMESPEMIAAWPGIGNIGVIAVDNLREMVQAEPVAEIEPWDFFYPHSVSIQDGELMGLGFPSCKFFVKRLEDRDVIFFQGEAQPSDSRRGYLMASMVLDMALRWGCRRIYTAAAAVAPIHHTSRPSVWAVPNAESLVSEVQRYPNTVLMSELERRTGKGRVTGLNGLLLGMAKRKGIEGICLLGEIPTYVSQFPLPYPRASQSILEILRFKLGVDYDAGKLSEMITEVDQSIEKYYAMIPQGIRDRIDRLKRVDPVQADEPITDDDKRHIMQDIEEFFKKGSQED